MKVKLIVTQSCLIHCDPMDGSPPGSSVHGILQARILEWEASHFSEDLPDPEIEPCSPALQADSLQSEPPGKSIHINICPLFTFPFHLGHHRALRRVVSATQ